jgi:protein ImuB
LFDSALIDAHGFAETLARAVAIVGSDRVGTPRVENTHRPDAVALAPPAASVSPSEPAADFWLRGLPLRRFRPCLPAKIELAGNTPAYLWTETVRGAVQAAQGPWRHSGDWWEAAREWEQEEWDVELDGGGLYRVLRRPDGRWFLAGEYD